MAGRDPVEVTVEVDGREVAAGTLWMHDRSGQSATFRYADSYLAEPGSYDLDPALPKAAGVFHTPPGSALFGAFADSAPDRWGENLMRREACTSCTAASSSRSSPLTPMIICAIMPSCGNGTAGHCLRPTT